jgi:hypothetical protein
VDIHTGKAPAGSDSVITAAVPGATPKLQPD